MIIEEFPERFQILSYIELSLAIAGLILNAFQIYTISVKKQKTIFQYLLRSLSTADILTCFISAISVLALFLETAQYPKHMFQASGEIYYITSGISTSHVIALTWDRFIAVFYPLRHRRMITKKRITCFLLILWSLHIVVSVVGFYLFYSGLYFYSLKLLLYVLISISGFSYTVVYSSIAVKIFRTSRSSHRQTGTKKFRRTLLVCFLTSALLLFTEVASLNVTMSNIWFFIILNSNTIINSLIYFGFMVLCRRCCKSTQGISES